MSDDRSRIGDELHALFSVLREHVVEVVDDFSERVHARVEELGGKRFDNPGILNLLFSSLLQGINLMGSDKDNDREAPPPEDDHEF